MHPPQRPGERVLHQFQPSRQLARPAQATAVRQLDEQLLALVLHKGHGLPSAWLPPWPEAVGPGDGQAEGVADLVADTSVPVGQLTGPIGLETDENNEQSRCAQRPIVDTASSSFG
jgi:hypothetical protein